MTEPYVSCKNPPDLLGTTSDTNWVHGHVHPSSPMATPLAEAAEKNLIWGRDRRRCRPLYITIYVPIRLCVLVQAVVKQNACIVIRPVCALRSPLFETGSP